MAAPALTWSSIADKGGRNTERPRRVGTCASATRAFVSNGTLDAIGDTPLPELDGVFAKCEYLGPSGFDQGADRQTQSVIAASYEFVACVAPEDQRAPERVLIWFGDCAY